MINACRKETENLQHQTEADSLKVACETKNITLNHHN